MKKVDKYIHVIMKVNIFIFKFRLPTKQNIKAVIHSIWSFILLHDPYSNWRQSSNLSKSNPHDHGDFSWPLKSLGSGEMNVFGADPL